MGRNAIGSVAAPSNAHRVALRTSAHPHHGALERSLSTTTVQTRILFVTAGVSRSREGLVRTSILARALEAELHVLSVVPSAHRMDSIVRNTHFVYDGVSLQRYLEACRQLQAWCQDLVPPECWQVRMGNFFEEVEIHTQTLHIDLVVLAPGNPHAGERVTSLARTTGLPVLFSRATIAANRTVVAATDLLGPHYPVLDRAADFGLRLGARVVALHNVAPRTRLESNPAQYRTGVRREQLTRATSQLSIAVTSVVAREADPVEAILRQAVGEDAGVILVGTRRHSWMHRLITDSVSARVVDEAQRSVLVIPFGD